MRLDYYEPAYTLDPLSILLMEEDDLELDPEVDILESERRAGMHRTAPKQADYEPSITRSRFTD